MPDKRRKRSPAPLLLALALTAVVGCGGSAPTAQVGTGTPGDPIPAFRWPPPVASAEAVIPAKLLSARCEPTLGDVARELERALEAAAYERKWSYSSVPNGFALVTHIEQIREDGTPSPEAARWSTDPPSARELGLLEFLKALAKAPPGFYRVIVFVVTDQTWDRQGDRPTEAEAKKWLARGHVRLPPSIGDRPYGERYETTVLVYEFVKQAADAEASLVEDSATRARDHLERAGIFDALSGWR